MLAWIHRNLPIVLASTLSVLVHAVVLFPLIEVLGSGRFNDDRAQTTLGQAFPGLEGAERDREVDRKEHLEKQVRRKMSIRRIQEDLRRRDPTPEPEKPKPDEPTPDEPEPDEMKVELGIDESDAVTMNWIGFAEYEKHLAALAEVEQAALRLEASSGARGSAPATLEPVSPGDSTAMSPDPGPSADPVAEAMPTTGPETTLVAATSPNPTSPEPATAQAAGGEPDPTPETVPPAATEPATAPATERKAEPVPDQIAEQLAEQLDVPELLARSIEDPDAGTAPERSVTPPATREPSDILPPTLPDASTPAADGADLLRDPREGADPDVVSPLPPGDRVDETRDPTVPADRAESSGAATTPAARTASNAVAGGAAGPQASPGQSSTPNAPSPAGAPGDTRSEQGRLSTRESDPTSTIDVPQSVWQFGAPLARKGIRLDTVRPRFTTLNLIDGIRLNPIVELVIGRDGVPQHVVISRSTGNLGANEELRSTLYKWRASGKQLEQLKPGQTITIRLRLIMLPD